MNPKLHLEDAITELDRCGPVFIMGCPRSGTTFLGNSIGHLPDVEMFIGILIPDRMMHVLGSGRLAAEDREDILWSLRFTLWRAFLKRQASQGETFLAAARGRLGWSDVRTRPRRPLTEFTLVYKEPFLVFAAPELADHFTRAKFIHIIRDGRDCADSLDRTYALALSDEILKDEVLSRQKGSEIGVSRRWGEWILPWWVDEGSEEAFVSHTPYGRYIWMWRNMVNRGREVGKTLGPDRYLEVRYEDLCREPESTGKRLVEFMQTRPHPRFSKYLTRASVKSIGIHRRQGADALAEAKDIGGDLLAELGYEV